MSAWFGAVVHLRWRSISSTNHRWNSDARQHARQAQNGCGADFVAPMAARQRRALLTRNVFRWSTACRCSTAWAWSAVVLTRDNLRIGEWLPALLLVFEHADARLPTPRDAHGEPARRGGRQIVAELLERWPALQPEAARAAPRRC